MTKPDLMAELAACPFCGGTPTSTEDEDAHVFVVGCLDCGYDLYSGPVGVGWFKSLPDAIAAWNKRTHHAELEAVVRDAARYRWLRDRANSAQGVAPMVLMVDKRCSPAFDQPGFGHKSMREGEYLDTAIDEQMHNSAREG